MKNVLLKDLTTERLILRKPSMNEQFTLWNILRDEKVNRYYFPTPDRIFVNNNLAKDILKTCRKPERYS